MDDALRWCDCVVGICEGKEANRCPFVLRVNQEAAVASAVEARRYGAEEMRKRAAQVLDAGFAGVLAGHGIKSNERTFRLMDDLATKTAELILLLPLEEK